MCSMPNDSSREPLDDDDSVEIEVVELVDDRGEKEEFGILEELTFEGRSFSILVPIDQLESQGHEVEGEEDSGMNLEIFEVKGENYVALEDDDLAERLMAHLDAQANQLADDED